MIADRPIDATNHLPSPVDVLTSDKPVISEDDATRFLRSRYGIGGTLSSLSSERDCNFLLRTADDAYVVKFTNSAEQRIVTNFQTQALLHIADKDPSLPVPKIVPDLDGLNEGLFDCAGTTIVARVLSFLEGTHLHSTQPSGPLMKSLGRTLARLDHALADYTHPASRRDLLWDITRTAELRKHTDHIPEMEERQRVLNFLDFFGERILPRLGQMRAQVIHNDMNPHNIVVAPLHHTEVSGIIDFGDMLFAPMINELATALSYQLTTTDRPFDFVRQFLAAYHAELPLMHEEIELLPDLIAARLVLTITISYWRATAYPENRTYILRNNASARQGFNLLCKTSKPDLINMFIETCRESSTS
jgi:Ser/Thr protein kinase RdoA (MazF antagonist)